MGRILIVNDSRIMLDLLNALLAGTNHHITVQRDGVSALEAIHREKPDLVLLEPILPGLNGYQICRAVKSDPDTAAIPVIMLKLHSSEDEPPPDSPGVDGYLTRPLTAEKLHSLLGKFVPLSE